MVAWHDSLDMGVIFSGVSYTGMGVSNDLYLIKRNPTPNEQRYVFINAGNFDSVLAPPGIPAITSTRPPSTADITAAFSETTFTSCRWTLDEPHQPRRPELLAQV